MNINKASWEELREKIELSLKEDSNITNVIINYQVKETSKSKNLVDFKNYQIEALQKKVFEQDRKISTLETYIFELIDKDCPEEYKGIVKNQLLKTD